MAMLTTVLTIVCLFSRVIISSMRVIVWMAVITLSAESILFFQDRRISVPFRSREYR